MSLQNLSFQNNYELFAEKISVKNITSDAITVDVINTGTVNADDLKVDTITSSNNSISLTKSIALPNIGVNTDQLSYYEYDSGSVTTFGAIITTLPYKAVRVGNMVSIAIRGTPTTINSTTTTSINMIFPPQFAPKNTDVYGLCITMVGASITTLGRYQLTSGGTLSIFPSLSSASFTSGQRAGFGSQSTYLTISFPREA